MDSDSTGPFSAVHQKASSSAGAGRAEPPLTPVKIPPPRASERRREARHQTNDCADVEAPSGKSFPAVVKDIARSGLTLEMKTPLARGVAIKVTVAGSVVVTGEVLNCRSIAPCFRLGVIVRSLSYPKNQSEQHCGDERLGLHLSGTGLNVLEFICLREHLKDCSRCRGRLAELRDLSLRKLAKAVMSLKAPDQRRYRRSGAKLQIRVSASCGGTVDEEARIIEISETGLSFIGPHYFDPQAEVQIEFDDCRLMAEVKHCRERQYAAATEFMTGVQIQTILEGSETWQALMQSVG